MKKIPDHIRLENAATERYLQCCAREERRNKLNKKFRVLAAQLAAMVTARSSWIRLDGVAHQVDLALEEWDK